MVIRCGEAPIVVTTSVQIDHINRDFLSLRHTPKMIIPTISRLSFLIRYLDLELYLDETIFKNLKILNGLSYESHEYLLNSMQLPIKGILIIRFLLTFSILIFSYQSNFAQSTKLQFDRPTVSEIDTIEKNFGGKVFRPAVLLVDSLKTPIPILPSLKYERLSGPFRTVITYRISQESLVENIRYLSMVSQKDSTFIKALFESDSNMINQNAGNSEERSYSDVRKKMRMNYWDRSGLHIRQGITLSNEIDMILYQIIIYWDDEK